MTRSQYASLPAPKTGRELRELVYAAVDREKGPGASRSLFGGTLREGTPVAFYPAQNSDGVDVLVIGYALPAQFYEIVPQTEGSCTWNTGSSMEDLAVQIAFAMSEAMLTHCDHERFVGQS